MLDNPILERELAIVFYRRGALLKILLFAGSVAGACFFFRTRGSGARPGWERLLMTMP